MLLMVCRLQELDGANVPHGLGVRWGILLACNGLFSWLKKLSARKKTHLAKNPTWEYVKKYCVPHQLTPTTKNQQTMAPCGRAARWRLLSARKRSATDCGVRFDEMSAIFCIVGGVGGCMTDNAKDDEVASSTSSKALQPRMMMHLQRHQWETFFSLHCHCI
jgi:hypothetical protein